MLHAHLPFVRHPEHEKFLEENWLYEAITECYVPLIQVIDRWIADGVDAKLTMSVSPTLCAMLRDPLLQERYMRHLDGLIELAEKETYRTHWLPDFNALAGFYHERFKAIRQTYLACGRDLVAALRRFQDAGKLEIATCAATHALLPLLIDDPPCLRAQILTARDDYRECFGRDPRGIWLPECAYCEGLDRYLREAGLRWFVTETHGVLHAQPRPRYSVFAPILTRQGVAAFGRDHQTARQVWSKAEGYPGDPRYRDFYRDVGFDLDFEYVRNYFPSPETRGFTGVKYHQITGKSPEKRPYRRAEALEAATGHAGHFFDKRQEQFAKLAKIIDKPPIVLAPYDAELFGHWWYEGPEFLDFFVRKACEKSAAFVLTTPSEYLRKYPTHQVAEPAASSWGEGGYWKVWLNPSNQWIYGHLRAAQAGMRQLAEDFSKASGLEERALKQAARELLLAQSSDWPFILHTGTSPDYARKRVEDHLARFMKLREQIVNKTIDAEYLRAIESADNLFPNVRHQYWASRSAE